MEIQWSDVISQENKWLNANLTSLIDSVLRNVFFIQERVGKWWDTFNVHKVRTMTHWSHHNVPSSVVTWDKQETDPRIMPTRRWMRKTWFDEIPQILNIVKWDMSFFWHRPMDLSTYSALNNTQKTRRDNYQPWIFGWYAFFNKWKWYKSKVDGYRPRTNRENQDVYLRLRYMIEKQWLLSMIKYNAFILLENMKALLKWVNR